MPAGSGGPRRSSPGARSGSQPGPAPAAVRTRTADRTPCRPRSGITGTRPELRRDTPDGCSRKHRRPPISIAARAPSPERSARAPDSGSPGVDSQRGGVEQLGGVRPAAPQQPGQPQSAVALVLVQRLLLRCPRLEGSGGSEPIDPAGPPRVSDRESCHPSPGRDPRPVSCGCVPMQ